MERFAHVAINTTFFNRGDEGGLRIVPSYQLGVILCRVALEKFR